jgi:serine/threonine-protein kinase
MELQELGPYELQEVLGRGGMGTVYRGVRKDTEQLVAVKVLAPFYASHDGFRERFTAEIRSLEKLRHPHIVTLYGYGEEGGVLFYVMELVPGQSLQDELANGRQFGWREACQIGVDICGALKQAHDHGVIHRDIKPANLLLDENDRAKLSDFGIAKLFGDTNLTVGGVLGTVDYMAPEQAEGRQPTPRCDLYSMGAVLYALLAGHAPFRGKTVAEVLQKLRYDEPVPLSRLYADIPIELETVIHQLLEKEPSDRIPTALALSKRLQSLLDASHVPIVEPPLDNNLDDIRFGVTGPDADDELARLHTIATDDAGQPSPPELARQETQDAPVNSAVKTPAATKKYVEVDEQAAPLTDSEPESRWYSALTLVALLASFVVIIGFIANAVRPPSANELFQQITTAIDSGDESRLIDQKGVVRRFVERFPDDERAAGLRELATQIDELHSTMRLESRLRRGTRSDKTRSPLEEKMLTTIRLEETDAFAAAAQYQALIDLYGDEDEKQTSTEMQCLRLAEQRLRQIRLQQAANASQFLARIRQRLAAARELDATEPLAAQRIRLAIVRLYEHEPWAQSLVDEVQQQLDHLSTEPSSSE